MNAIPLEEDIPIYGYVRRWRNGEVGYSVLEEPTAEPDFSNCSVFWMKPEDFAKVFDVQNVIDGNDVWRMPITNGFIEGTGMTKDELFDTAILFLYDQ